MRLLGRLRRKIERIRNFFNLYLSGMNRKEIERVLKKDTLEAYAYLKTKTHIEDRPAPRSRLKTIVYVCKEIFVSFVMQLTPARRFLYGVGAVFFLLGAVHKDLLYMVCAFLILNVLLIIELVDRLTTRDELEIACKIQMGLQPVSMPETSRLSIAGYSQPARLVGGDFFDIIKPNENCVISIVGDVSDKGVSAALYAAYAQSMFNAFSENSISPAAIFKSLNKLISRKLRSGDFITAVIAVFDLQESTVTLARAGHNWPLHYRADTEQITALKPRGLSIGLCDDDLFGPELEELKLPMNPGDLLLLYTDGVTEAMDSQNRMFEQAGLERALKESAHQSSQEIIDCINKALQAFVRADDLQDDATLVALKAR